MGGGVLEGIIHGCGAWAWGRPCFLFRDLLNGEMIFSPPERNKARLRFTLISVVVAISALSTCVQRRKEQFPAIFHFFAKVRELGETAESPYVRDASEYLDRYYREDDPTGIGDIAEFGIDIITCCGLFRAVVVVCAKMATACL